jgi:hypothetical protein
MSPLGVWAYVTAPTGKVHLVDQLTLARPALTLCGRLTDRMPMGDETLNGRGATCKTCRRIGAEPGVPR